MMARNQHERLVVLAADRDIEETLREVSLAHCQDPAFSKLRAVLQGWFPVPPPRP